MISDNCSECNGRGQITCPACEGTKISEASKGNYSWEPCALCGGTGTVTCPNCHGSGKEN